MKQEPLSRRMLLKGLGSVAIGLPLLVAGPLGEGYLSQTAAGQAADSPCVDAADPAAAHVEDLDGGLQLVLGEGDDIGVGAVAEHHGLLLGVVARLRIRVGSTSICDPRSSGNRKMNVSKLQKFLRTHK